VTSPLPAYRGRLAPTASGYLHCGHARTFAAAADRATQAGGELLLRIEDIDPQRCRPAYLAAIVEDLAWLGLHWQPAPSTEAGPGGAYLQSRARQRHEEAWRTLARGGFLYLSPHSRREIRELLPGTERDGGTRFPLSLREPPPREIPRHPGSNNWRFRVPEGRVVRFTDARCGPLAFTAGEDFGDFLVWRRDDAPAYELAGAVDDLAQEITEVVRGEDLLLSTARQLLLLEALGGSPPTYCHLPLVRDPTGRRLSKTERDLALRELRARGHSPSEVLAMPVA
jgi:glutamyl-tRNA synthetase